MSVLEEMIVGQLSRYQSRLVGFANKAATRPRYTTWLCNQMRGRETGFTYFVRMEAPIENPPVKIGFSVNPCTRLSDFACGSPYPLTLVATFPACLLPEKLLHERYSHLRMRGEWFSPDTELADLIDSVQRVSRHYTLTIGADERTSASVVSVA